MRQKGRRSGYILPFLRRQAAALVLKCKAKKNQGSRRDCTLLKSPDMRIRIRRVGNHNAFRVVDAGNHSSLTVRSGASPLRPVFIIHGYFVRIFIIHGEDIRDFYPKRLMVGHNISFLLTLSRPSVGRQSSFRKYHSTLLTLPYFSLRFFNLYNSESYGDSRDI